MTKSDDNAFPLGNAEMTASELGLTKREYFAALAIAGGASPKAAVTKADELIKELNKPETK